MRKFFTSFAIVGALMLTIGLGAAFASHAGYTLFGDATIVAGEHPGQGNSVRLRSVAPGGFGGVDYDVPAGTTFAQFTELATDYKFELDDSCGGGSPRFQVNVESPTDEGNIHVYIGPPPGYVGCPPNTWLNTGDLLEGANPIDTSQLNGGTFYDPYNVAVGKYGSYIVTGVQLVVDGSWFPPFLDGEQTGFFDNTNIDGHMYTYDEGRHATNKDDCKDGGWMDLVREDGTTFKNQGDCVSYTNTGK